MSESRLRLGASLGILVFIGGIALLGLTFWDAYILFRTPPAEALGLVPKKPLDLNETGTSLLGVVLRITLMLVMCIVGSVIANRGIKLFIASGGTLHARSESERKNSPTPLA